SFAVSPRFFRQVPRVPISSPDLSFARLKREWIGRRDGKADLKTAHCQRVAGSGDRNAEWAAYDNDPAGGKCPREILIRQPVIHRRENFALVAPRITDIARFGLVSSLWLTPTKRSFARLAVARR